MKTLVVIGIVVFCFVVFFASCEAGKRYDERCKKDYILKKKNIEE